MKFARVIGAGIDKYGEKSGEKNEAFHLFPHPWRRKMRQCHRGRFQRQTQEKNYLKLSRNQEQEETSMAISSLLKKPLGVNGLVVDEIEFQWTESGNR